MVSVFATELDRGTPEAIDRAVATLLDQHRSLEGRDVLLVPATDYPHEPSTGLVTDPAVVEALAEAIGGEVAVGVAGSDRVDAERVGRLLGYEDITERGEASLVDLDVAGRVERRVTFAGGSTSVEVPAPMLENAVVVVPTLRRSKRHGVATGMVTLANAVTDAPTREEVLAATRACWPALTVLDATVAYDGTPRRMDRLLSSEDVIELSAAAVTELGVDRSHVPHLEPNRSPPSPIRGLKRALAGGADGDGPDLIDRGYRRYAQATGDLVPPQMLSRGDHE